MNLKPIAFSSACFAFVPIISIFWMPIFLPGSRTIIFSTHIMAHAEQICNKICILKNGTVKTSGTLAEVKSEHGRNTVVIDFEGSASFIKELPFVNDLIEWPGSCEVSLVNEENVEQKLLKAAAEKLKISRFEVQRPSLHKIFVDLAGSTEGENNE